MSLDSFKQQNDAIDFGIQVTNEEEMLDLSEYEKFNINELEADIELEGRPFLMYFENSPEDERTYESIRLQLMSKQLSRGFSEKRKSLRKKLSGLTKRLTGNYKKSEILLQ